METSIYDMIDGRGDWSVVVLPTILFAIPIIITVFKSHLPSERPWQRIMRSVLLALRAISLVLAILCAGLYLVTPF